MDETERALSVEDMMIEVIRALKEKGYDPVTQITSYLLSEDPVYITSHNRARKKISGFWRDEILAELSNVTIEITSLLCYDSKEKRRKNADFKQIYNGNSYVCLY